MSINSVTLSGRLTRDPELRHTQSGMGVLDFGVAVNDRRRDSQSGEWGDYANFVDCTVFGARADGLSTKLAKGTKVSIHGKLRWSQWERDGVKHSKLKVIVDELDFLFGRPADSASAAQSGGQDTRLGAQGASAGAQVEQPKPVQGYSYPLPEFIEEEPVSIYDDDIPF